MKIKWYGTASLLIESGGASILIDPYCKNLNKKLPRVSLDEARKADAIVITHPHLDHFEDIDAFTVGGGVERVYVPQIGIEIGKKMGHDTSCMVPMSEREVYEIGPFTVKTYESRHCKFDFCTLARIALSPRTYIKVGKAAGLLRGMKNYKIGERDILAFEISDGEKRVFVFGSAGLAEGISYPAGCDLLVFPYQGRARMHRYMEKFFSILQPKGVFADHFDNAFPPFTHKINMKKFAETVEKHLPEARCIVPKEGEWYEV